MNASTAFNPPSLAGLEVWRGNVCGLSARQRLTNTVGTIYTFMGSLGPRAHATQFTLKPNSEAKINCRCLLFDDYLGPLTTSPSMGYIYIWTMHLSELAMANGNRISEPWAFTYSPSTHITISNNSHFVYSSRGDKEFYSVPQLWVAPVPYPLLGRFDFNWKGQAAHVIAFCLASHFSYGLGQLMMLIRTDVTLGRVSGSRVRPGLAWLDGMSRLRK